jgi:hypothetical protein
LDKKQMTLQGWGKIDFNWANSGEGARANFFGCRTGVNPSGADSSFAAKISGLSNFKNVEVAGQTSSSFPSQFTNYRLNSEKGPDNFVYHDDLAREWFQITYMVAGKRRSDDWNLNEQNDAYKMQINKNGTTIDHRYQPGKTKP